MKRNDLTEIKKMNLAALEAKAGQLKKEIADLILEKKMNKISNLKIIKSRRKDLAQIFTIRRQKQLLAEMEGGGK